MKANERRMAILEALCERRREQVANLAFEFGVTEWTIRQDILTLSLSYPVYTVQGISPKNNPSFLKESQKGSREKTWK